jgi:glycosyltransferase involved in cell wall biosynthesis
MKSPEAISKLPSLSSLAIFFPFYNDAGTVQEAIQLAYAVGSTVTNDLEVIALHGGNSADSTWSEILAAKEKQPSLRIIDKKDNFEGYAVIKYGLSATKKEWVFYTDGDLQYDVSELPKLVTRQNETKAKVVNGYKIHRGDNIFRTSLGSTYQYLSRLLFQLPIKDTDCDFRLIKTSLLEKINLTAQDASILPELLTKLKSAGATFAEVPVSHRKRKYGVSNYTTWQLMSEKIIGDLRMWWKIHR